MSSDNPLTIIDDRELLALSATPAARVFPVLDRARALSPLLVVLAVLPAVYAVSYSSMTSADAYWGLRAVRMIDADARQLLWLNDDFDQPSTSQAAAESGSVPPAEASSSLSFSDKPALLVGQPPLATWLTVLAMRLFGTSSTVALSLVSAIASGAQLLMLCLLVNHLLGVRAACWSTFLTAFHGPLLLQIQSSLPTALTAVCGLGALWGGIAHLQGEPRIFSWPLLFGGICLALCFLAGGPVAFGILAVLLFYPLTIRGNRTLTRRRPGDAPRKSWLGWPALRSMLSLTLFGLVGGCWWIVSLQSQSKSVETANVLSEWWRGGSLPQSRFDQFHIGGVPSLLWESMQTFVVLAGLLAVSLVWLSRVLSRKPPSGRDTKSGLVEERSAKLLLLWFGLFAVLWVVSLSMDSVPRQMTLLCRNLLILPAIVVCSFGLEYIMQRRVAARWALSTLAFSLALPWLIPPVTGFRLPEQDFLQARLPQPTEVRTSATDTTSEDEQPVVETRDGNVAADDLSAESDGNTGAETPDVVLPPTSRISDFSVAETELVPSLLRFAVRGSIGRLVLIAVALGVILGVGWRFLQGWAGGNDERCRSLLGLFVIILLVAHGAFGLAGIRSSTADDETREQIAVDLATVDDVDHWVILSERPLPLPMRFTLESVWPRAEYTRFDSWDRVLSRALTEKPTRLRKMVVVEWNGPPNRPTRLMVPGLKVQQIGAVRFLWANRLRTYALTQFRRPQ